MSGPRKIPDALLERYLSDDLPAARKADLDATLKDSPADQAKLNDLRAESAAFLIAHPPGPLVAKLDSPQPTMKWFRWLVPAFVVAAAVLVFLLVRTPQEDPLLGVKGKIAFTVFRKTGETSEVLAPSAVVHPKESVRFELRAESTGFAAVVSKDGAGNVTVYYPYGKNEAAAYDPKSAMLPGAIGLDEALGEEHVFAVYSAQPFALGPLKKQLESKGTLTAGPDQEIAEFVWRKE